MRSGVRARWRVFLPILALGLLSGAVASAEGGATKNERLVRRDFAETDRFSLAALMEFDILAKATVDDALYVQRSVYRPAIQFEAVPGWQTANPFSRCPHTQFAIAAEMSYSRADRFFGGDDAKMKLVHLWVGAHGVVRSVYGVLGVEWLRVRLSVGPTRLTVTDQVADVSNFAWRARAEVAGLVGLRIWSFFVLQGGVSYVFGGDDFAIGASDAANGKRTVAPKEGPAAVLRAGLEYRFGGAKKAP